MLGDRYYFFVCLFVCLDISVSWRKYLRRTLKENPSKAKCICMLGMMLQFKCLTWQVTFCREGIVPRTEDIFWRTKHFWNKHYNLFENSKKYPRKPEMTQNFISFHHSREQSYFANKEKTNNFKSFFVVLRVFQG